GKHRELVFVEGVRLCEEAVRAALQIESVLCAETLRDDTRVSRLLASLRMLVEKIAFVSDAVLESVSDTKHAQGIVILARRPEDGQKLIERSVGTPLLVIMHRVGNPSNAGAMLRVAEAAGATAAISTQGSTDLFSPKALRGSMGSAFRLPLWTGAQFDEIVGWCSARGIKTVCTAARSSLIHTELDWTLPRAVIVGSEASGLEPSEIAVANDCVSIPMREPVESLNAAVALSVVLYEAARQRGFR
ncbi:MAG: RNA methyltransferase, partial [Pyrinomonadaceae bacterium]